MDIWFAANMLLRNLNLLINQEGKMKNRDRYEKPEIEFMAKKGVVEEYYEWLDRNN